MSKNKCLFTGENFVAAKSIVASQVFLSSIRSRKILLQIADFTDKKENTETKTIGIKPVILFRPGYI